MDKLIPVTKPFLPRLEDYMAQVQRAYNNEWLTNRGELVLELENKIQGYLSSKSKPILMNNGTIPLQIALKLLGKEGEVITTPFSYVATTSTIVWEGCTPVFVDIDPVYWTIDETKIEEAITEKTTCILATHVFGNPCNVEEIERIAKKHNLYVIYDSAHCFGVKYKGKSIFDWGDISTCSFHATKIFHTGEGGAAFVNNEELQEKVFYSHNFGHNGPIDFHGVGINGKMSELQAAMGLAVLPHIDEIIEKRKNIYDIYKETLVNDVEFMTLRNNINWNFSYSQILLKHGININSVIQIFKENHIILRRYFYPSLNKIDYINNNVILHISENIADKIITHPNYYTLNDENISTVVKLLNSVY
jgi:dTDP-4-amino-4,6-dideoxygalactose transaminase